MTETALSFTSSAPFNRYCLRYTSTIPLRCHLSYRLKGSFKSEVFYLEAGEDGEFFSFIDGYLAGETGDAGELTLRANSITGEEGKFTVTRFWTEQAPVIAERTCYVENDFFRIGVELAWGGGLSVFEDKHCPVPELKNLLNRHDTGRLVQQSYYGMRQPPYRLGSFMGNDWCYNPVQGGDKGNFRSKLIDARVEGNVVYVKCRPRDWGHSGGDTYCYMENRYVPEGDCLRVENRFVDFSGWSHPESTQELPAFYTVSRLGNYYYYDGDAPWTGAPLSHKDDLPFWPDDWAYCTFTPSEQNTERWTAFVDDSLYGIGLFTPGTDKIVAGRYKHDGSTDPDGDPTNYIAPEGRIRLRCFEPLCYSYLITAGSLEDIRARFAARRDTVTPPGYGE